MVKPLLLTLMEQVTATVQLIEERLKLASRILGTEPSAPQAPHQVPTSL